jgi:methylglutaconyl-CoA hydratase
MTHTENQGTLTTTIENKIATVQFGHPASNSSSTTLIK